MGYKLDKMEYLKYQNDNMFIYNKILYSEILLLFLFLHYIECT